ncbi:sodium:proton exchanger [Flavobacterium salilacus subsp. salilacus]|uniref:cation:proton antiporter n=1 Tax=Flavobacterium TaxID=237 RepID=UPI001074A5B6|nr:MULTISPECIES: cation:proton antiporter [Flavobacterium]KAF2518776.1 sodium:proton exchanger [Flavobacterium salilacus subsp. salilacus]MBE1613744.1 cation:proton antiporter [Flavobacterium sp. SaA2.13]
MPEYFKPEEYNFILLATGIIALLAAIVPVVMQNKIVSAPIVYILCGIASYFLLLRFFFNPMQYMETIKHVTEFVIIISLTNAGLKIKEPFRWHTWRSSFRLLIIAFPITMVAAACLGWWIAGLAPVTAILFGTLITPTDPVLAGELQTSQPSEEDTSKIRLGLTSEAGLNDGLAFPFTYFAIMAAQYGFNIETWVGEWLWHYVIFKIGIALVVGLLTGWTLFKIIFNIAKKSMLSKISRGILSLALTLLPYALTEIVGGYGFIAVFIAACMFSRYEKFDKHMDSLHDFNEELESLVVAVIFIITGIFIASHYYILLNPGIVAVALIMILVVRPVAGYTSFIRSNLNPFQKFVLSFYGIRGIGSIFYLAYALTSAEFKDAEKLFDITIATIFFSVLIHGLTAHIIQKRINIYDS